MGQRSRRHVALLCHPYHRGGVTRWMCDAAAEWHARGTAVSFIVPEPRIPFYSGKERVTVTSLLRQRLPESSVVAPAVDGRFEFGLAAFRAGTYAKAVRATVPPGVPLIVSDDPSVWAAGAALARRNPMIGVLHADEAAYYELAALHAPALSAAVAVSHRITRRASPILEPYGVPVRTIPCGIRMGESAPGIQASAPCEAVRLLWLGRIDERQKRVSDLPQIVAAARQRNVPCELDIVGDGAEREMLRDEAHRLGIAGVVRLHGWRDSAEIRAMLDAADLLLLPSNFEGMPIAAMEALAAGCAVVASRASGLEEYQQHPLADGSLFLFDVGAVDEAVSAIERALSIPARSRGESARALAEAVFGLPLCLDRYDAMIDELQAHARKPTIRRVAPLGVSAVLSHPVAAARRLRVRAHGGVAS